LERNLYFNLAAQQFHENLYPTFGVRRFLDNSDEAFERAAGYLHLLPHPYIRAGPYDSLRSSLLPKKLNDAFVKRSGRSIEAHDALHSGRPKYAVILFRRINPSEKIAREKWNDPLAFSRRFGEKKLGKKYLNTSKL
jgi:hypothetical protein